MVKKEVLIIDKLVIGYNHIIFNAAITGAIANIYKDHKVTFISESVHSKAIQNKNASVLNLNYQPFIENTLPNSSIKKLIPWVSKKIGDLFFIGKLYKNQIKNADAVIFTCLSTSTLWYAGYKAKRLNIPVFFFLHGEIEYLFQEKVRFFSKIRAKIYKLFLNRLGKTSKVLVLSEIIKDALTGGGYLPADKIATIEHPIIPVDYIQTPFPGRKTVFGHIGIALLKKSSDVFFQTARYHKTEIENGNTEFRLIGKIEHALVLDDVSAVNILSKNNESLTQNEYEENINLIDYAIFTFTGDNYVYRASGSVMDAITFAKPIIALKHAYFNYLFKSAGNIGFLCDNIEGLNNLLERIIKKDEDVLGQYKLQQANLRELMKEQTIEAIENKLSAIIKKTDIS